MTLRSHFLFINEFLKSINETKQPTHYAMVVIVTERKVSKPKKETKINDGKM